jgi:magnesium transporter
LILNFKESLISQKEVLSSFEVSAQNLFGESFKYHIHAITGEYQKVFTKIENTKEYLDELRRTNDSLLSTKQNEIMKNLTLMSFVVFPLSLVASIFGMNTSVLPLVGTNNDFWKVMVIMLALTALMFALFKKRGWL